jgi:UDP-glucose 4-epimerase
VAASIENPAADYENSVGVLRSVLDSVRTLGADISVLFLSSAAVYGNQDKLPIREDAIPNPISPYGSHKLISEQLLQEYQACFGVRACALRIFSAYGPGLKRQLMWDICRKATAEKTVVLDGTGRETRDFVHCDDIALAVEAVIERAPFQAEKYNLASGEEISVRDLSTGLVRAMGMKRPVRFSGNHRPGDPLRWRADITSISRLGFQPKVPLAEGLAAFAKWALAQKELLD